MDRNQRQDDDRQRVKDASDIVRVVGEHVSLKPKGREFVGLCPFHDDRNPSMAVVPAKQIFHCFVCGTGGDVYSFVQKYHSMDFREAIEFSARRSGIELTKRQPKREPMPGELPGINKADILRANDTAQGFFKAILKHPEHGAIARQLIERRGISAEMVEQFGIGASPDRWDGLLVTIEGKQLDPRPFDAAGLLKTRDSGGRYDALARNRLIFPIHDQIGRVIAFGGRRINDEDDPKYLNSPETPAFRKNTTLYGISQASRSIQQQRTAVVVEGYTDVVACHQAGVTNVVGTLGTALTSGHATVLRRLCDTVVLLFDGDVAGQKAADRAVEVLFSEQLDIRVASLATVTDAKDPDEVLKLPGGRALFEQAVSRAKDLLAWKFERLRVSLEGKGPAAIANAVEEELDRFARLGMSRLSPVRRRQLVRLISDATGIGEQTIQSQIKTGGAGPEFGRETRSDDTDQAPGPKRGEDASRELILGCLLADGSLWATMTSDQRDRIRVDVFPDAVSGGLADAVLRAALDSGVRPDLDHVLAEIDAEDESAPGVSAWAVTLQRTVERQTMCHPERLRRLLAECLSAAGLEDEKLAQGRGSAVVAGGRGPQQSMSGPSESVPFGSGGSDASDMDASDMGAADGQEAATTAAGEGAALVAFMERQRMLRAKYGRTGVNRLGGDD